MADITNRADWIVFSNRGATQDTHHATSCASATDVSEVNIVNKAAGTFNVIDANNVAAALTQQAGLPGNPAVTSEKPAPAAKGPKDSASILQRVASEKAAIKLVLQLRALGQAVAYIQADTGPWQVRIRRVGFPAQTETLPTRKAAKEWATLREAEYHKREMTDYREADRITLGQLLLRYRDGLPVDPLADNSLHHRLSKIARNPVCEYKMSALRPTHIAHYRDERLKLVKPATVVAELSHIASIIGHARREWDIAMPRNVATAEFVKRPKIGADGERTRRFEAPVGDVSEEQRLFDALMEVRNKALRVFIVVALETGIRRAELLRLKWSMVFLDRSYIALSAEITKGKHARQSPLSSMAIEALRSLAHVGELVFEGETRDSVKCCFARLRQRAGLKDFRLHDLRHEFASRLFEETNLREYEIQFLTGHRDARMLARYSHLRPTFMVERLAQSRAEMKALKQNFSQEVPASPA